MAGCQVRGEGWTCGRPVEGNGKVCHAHRTQFSRAGMVWRVQGRGHVDREYGRVPKGYAPVPRAEKNRQAMMPLKEIAAEMGITVQAVQQTERRALAKLKAGLEGWL